MSNVALEVGMHAYNVTDSFVNYGMWKIESKSEELLPYKEQLSLFILMYGYNKFLPNL